MVAFSIIHRQMARVSPEMKSKLIADGRWAEFVRFRDGRIAAGTSPIQAKIEAIAAVCPEFAAEAPGRKCGAKPKGWTKEAEDAEAVGRVAAATEKVEALVERKAERDRRERAAKEERYVDVGVFAGKSPASAADEVLWVAKNLNMRVEAKDAPGELAWNFLEMCRESAEFRVKFMLNIASDVVRRRGDEEADGREGFDGGAEYDILASLGEDRR